MDQKTTYTINHGFGHDGVYYNRDNEADVAKLPSEVIADMVARGVVTEHKAAAAPAGIRPLSTEA